MNNRSPHARLLSVLVSASIFLTGCWDIKEMEQVAIIKTLGIDYLSSGEWQISARILNPLPGKAEKGGMTSSSASADTLLKGTGRSMSDAINDFSKRLPRIPFWGSLDNVIVGEKAARNNIKDIVEVHLRHREGRPRTNLIITKGTAYEILQTGPEISNNLSKEIKNLANLTIHRFGTSVGSNYAEFTQGLLSPDRDPVATEIKIIEPEETKFPDTSGPAKTVYLEGLAVFRGEQLAGWLDKEDTLGYIMATKKLRRAEIPYPMDLTPGKDYAYLIGRTDNKIIPQVDGEKISYTLNVKTTGVIVDSNGLPLTLENIQEVEQQISAKLLEVVLKTIKKSKEYNSDFLGFSMTLHRSKPETWKKIKSRWRDSFQEAEIKVVVEAKVAQTGRHGEQFKIQKEQ